MERIARTPDEADLPAQEAPSRQGARLPGPNEDLWRSSRAGCSAGSRSKATDGLTLDRDRPRPRLVMLSVPRVLLRFRGVGRFGPNRFPSHPSFRRALEHPASGLQTG